ncbi:MAG: FAD-linked oxidase, partial [Anaerolineae bacterium]|nr:FAD-linked oxidase [Anaerolineae bacterium]
MIERTLTDLKSHISGEVVLPDSPRYEELRNGVAATGSPALIVQPRSSADVAAAIAYTREN